FSIKFFVIFVLLTALPLPIPAGTVLTVAAGALVHPVIGILIASFGGTIGCALAFLGSRFIFRDLVKSLLREKLVGLDKGIREQGAFYLVTLRLIPVMPFPAVNMAMGVTPIPFWTYVFVSQVSMLFGAFPFFYAGTQLSTVQSMNDIMKPGIILAMVLL